VGSPSYGEIDRRVSAARQGQGMSEHAARVARSTVYDLFVLGKARINLELVHEVAASLGVSPAQVDAWVELCHSPPRVADDEVPERTPAVPSAPSAPSIGQQAALVLACIAINLVGRALVDVLHLPIYLDMVGTAIAAIALGPWRGAGVGVATNAIGVLASGWVSLPFAAVNVVGALMWGYGVHRFGWGRTLARFFSLCVAVAVACSLVAVPILVGVYGGSVGQGQDTLTQTFTDLGSGLLAAVGAANLMVSTADKLISGFVALVVVSALPARALLLPESSIPVTR
jgi:energy-coupling factor transport system substrate-specific component